jgi:pimeloyl-ACP methyl ester carboxylesterase
MKTQPVKSIFQRWVVVAILALFSGGSLFSQPFQTGHASLTFVDTARNNRSIPVEIYYPADAAGDNVSMAVSFGEKYPVLSFGHGFVMTWDAYQNIWNAVVPEGFIIVFPKTEGSFSPSHTELARDLAFVIRQVQALGQDGNSIFFNRVDSLNCVMGHSMGGGAAFLAASFDAGIKTLATLAPAETSASAIQAAGNLQIPALVFAGANDCVTPPANHQLPMFNALASECKTYLSITGGSHCQMANSNFFCTVGEATCTPAPAISRAEQHQIINRYLLPWLKFQLKNDCVAGASMDSLILIDAAISFDKNCELCKINIVADSENDLRVEISPNPFTDFLKITLPEEHPFPVDFLLYDLGSKIILRQTFQDSVSLNTNQLPAGLYFFELKNKAGRVAKGNLVKK